jgi:hypothetical protein
MAKTTRIKSWKQLTDEEILQMRIRDLNVQIAGSALEPLVENLYDELDAKGLRFRPPCYLADEWLCPDKVPIMGIPFCLVHPRLKRIEQKMMFDVEGGTEQSCMKLLRHECGHTFNYAYELYRRTRWRELFGPFSARYSDSYYFQPYSRRYVTNLQNNYAQAHPDEDFAETFAVWLAPDSRWQQKYQGWPVMKKLRYVERLMENIRDQAPVKTAQGQPPWSASRMTSTLAAHYERKRRALGSEFQGFYDDSLKALFTAGDAGSSDLKAATILRQHRRNLVDSVTRWTGHRKYDVHQLVNSLIGRCNALKLYAETGDRDNIIGLAALLTAIASNTLRGPRRHKHP